MKKDVSSYISTYMTRTESFFTSLARSVWLSVSQSVCLSVCRSVCLLWSSFLLIRGTASDVAGMDSDTVFRNTVNERRIVTSEKISAVV